MRTSRLGPSLLLLTLPLACAQGSGDPMGTLSGAFSADDDGSGGGSEGDDATSGNSSAGSATSTSGMSSAGSDSAGDTGNPLCCSVSPTPGCESPDTESCVCATFPACCQQVWGVDCVEQAIACGDPYCSDGTGGDDTTGQPPDLECDPDFGFDPGNPAPNVGFVASFTDPVGLTFVGMNAEGPAGQVVNGGHSGTRGSEGNFNWTFDFPDGLSAGVWTFRFTWHQNEGDSDVIQGVCQKQF